jgi:hypothetical protein
MTKSFFSPLTSQQRQAYVLVLLGGLLLLGAWLLRPDPFNFPAGILLLGVGMLIATIFHPTRLLIASSLTTAIGIAVFLAFKQLIPGDQVFPAYIFSLGIGLLVIAIAARLGYVGQGALSPAMIVIGIGLVEVLLIARLTPPWLIPFALSLWLPGLSLLALGIIYLVIGSRPG